MRRGIGRLRAGGGLTGAPTANMVAWFRKGVGITSVANAVSAWADQTGLGSRDYTQATGANQPTLQAGGTIVFDGTNDNLKTPAFTLGQPFTRYLRMRQVTWTDGDYMCDGLTNLGALIYQVTASPSIQLFAGSGAAITTGLALNTWGSVAAVFDGASSVLQVDNTTTTGNPGAGLVGGLTLGSNANSGIFANIEVAEEIVYNIAHDANTRARVIAYLATL